MCVNIVSVHVHIFPRPSILFFLPVGPVITPLCFHVYSVQYPALIYNAYFSKKMYVSPGEVYSLS